MARGAVPNGGEGEREKSKSVGALRRLGPFLSPYRMLVGLAGFPFAGAYEPGDDVPPDFKMPKPLPLETALEKIS